MSDDDDEELAQALDSAVPDIGAGVIAAAVAMALPGPAGLVVGALTPPVMSRVLGRLQERFFQQRATAAEAVLQEAADQLGTDLDGVLAALTDDSRVQLAGMAVAAGAQTILEDKIVALGRALATGVLADDEALIDEQRLVIGALASLEAPHIRVLRVVAEEWPPGVKFGDQPRWPEPEIAAALRMSHAPSTVSAILSGLHANHLLRQEDVIKQAFENYSRAAGRAARSGGSPSMRTPTPRWEVTPFGERMLALLRDVAEADVEAPE